jgi:mono/diheme cytochrome c family protein
LTQIPDHLLKRSRERRAATSGAGEGDDRGVVQASEPTARAAQAASVPATAPSMPTHPAPETRHPPCTPSPMAEAHRQRHKIPFWAMPVLVALPLWAYIYQGTLSPQPTAQGPEALGAELYSQTGCAGCHGAGGAGSGSFPGFTNGRIFETFPNWTTHYEWVRLGSTGWLDEHGATYGATAKPVRGGMPAFTEGQLSDAELLYIVLHERLLGGASPNGEDMDQLQDLALHMSEHEGLTLAEAAAQLGLDISRETDDPAPTTPSRSQVTEREDTPGSAGNEPNEDGQSLP